MMLGVIGMSVVLIAYLLNLFNKVTVESERYLMLNFLGCVLLFAYAFQIDSTPFMVVNAVWGLSAVFKLITGSVKKERLQQ